VNVQSTSTARDPRLNPLDLRTTLQSILLTIIDNSGQLIAEGRVVKSDPVPTDFSQVIDVEFTKGTSSVIYWGKDVDLRVISDGYLDVCMHHVHQDQLVTLRRAPRLTLVLANDQRPPE